MYIDTIQIPATVINLFERLTSVTPLYPKDIVSILQVLTDTSVIMQLNPGYDFDESLKRIDSITNGAVSILHDNDIISIIGDAISTLSYIYFDMNVLNKKLTIVNATNTVFFLRVDDIPSVYTH